MNTHDRHDQFKAERKMFDEYVEACKTTPAGLQELKVLRASLGDMGQRVFQADHGEI